jgi:hypothetical protein
MQPEHVSAAAKFKFGFTVQADALMSCAVGKEERALRAPAVPKARTKSLFGFMAVLATLLTISSAQWMLFHSLFWFRNC